MICLRELLLETLTFSQLMSLSDPARVGKAGDVRATSKEVVTLNDGESWTFSYKSNPSTTGKRHKGYVKFFKKDLSSGKSADRINCVVDCTCPDYKYRFAYPNHSKDAGKIGADSWNQNNGQSPLPINNKPGLCKHLIAIARFLKTKIDKKRGERE